MERYKEYKDSGVQWLGEIPSHWDVKRAKYIFEKNKRPVRPEDEVITCFRDGEVTLRKNRRTSGFTESLTEVGYQGVRKGDLVIHQMDAFAGAIGISDSDGKGTSVYHCCTPICYSINTRFFMYFIRQMAHSGFIQSLYRGIRERSSDFNFQVFKNQYLSIPPLSEQEKIVSFIDSKSTKIDSLVADLEKQITLLNELKQTEIANAVTKGLNSNAKMKDSGISWIGEIPDHWEVKQLRNYLKIFSEKGHPEETLLSVVREQGVIIRDTESKEENHNFIPEDLSGYKFVKKGQFVINKMKAWQGSYAVSDYTGIVSPAYYVCELNFGNKQYFNLAIRSKSYIPFFTQYSKGIRVGQWDLSTIGLKSIPFIEPPIEEQNAIVDYINEKTSKIDILISELQSQIEHLKEYKQRLISDAVTGQINVQNIE